MKQELIMTMDECEHDNIEGDVCEDCGEEGMCEHGDIECGMCNDCGAHMSNFMDEDYGSDR
jgi:hypothetical protein